MRPAPLLPLHLLATSLALLTAPAAAKAGAEDCGFSWASADSSKRPSGRWHKVRIRMPDALAEDPAAHQKIAAAITGAGASTILDTRTGNGPEFFVRATDAQLVALARRLARIYQMSADQTRDLFQYADNIDLLETGALTLDTGVTRPDRIPVPLSWVLPARPGQRAHWLIHFAAQRNGDSWFVPLRSQTGPLARPEPITLEHVNPVLYLARMTPAQADEVRKLPGVEWVARYEAIFKLGNHLGPPIDACSDPCPDPGRLYRCAEAQPDEKIQLSVQLFEPNPKLVAAIAAEHGIAFERSPELLLVKGPRRLIRWLARRPEVRSISVNPPAMTP